MAPDDSKDRRERDDENPDETLLSGPAGAAGEDDATIGAGGLPPSRPTGDGAPGRAGWIGDYEILGKLGEGGMGVVYEARQKDPSRIVALKVIRGGAFVDDARVKMFEREVETLARLSHPNIGAIYESGRTEDGRHFFAMELVRGPALDEYLAGRPPVDAPGELEHRLRLFASIASTVHYAHQRGVIHRDLKPSNIIVSDDTQSGISGSASGASAPGLPHVKILDFGLARITDEDVVDASMVTEIGVVKGTLPYMSPEQARGDAAAIDVRTDVYALGVMLYEMVCGQKPYDVARASLLEAVRVICQEPPRPLSVQWSGRRRLDRDVETVAGKALAKEPERRYDSAAALADDVNRFLHAQPILARPPSALYQIRKFAQRHRPTVVGAGLALLALVAGAVTSTTLFFKAEREAERARVEAATSEQISTFLRSMLEGVGPSVAQGRDTALLEDVLERADERVEAEIEGEPILEAHIRSTLGTVYFELNEFERTERQFTRALEIYRAEHGDEHEDVAQSYFNLGLFESKRGDYDKAEEYIKRSIELARLVHGDQASKTAEFTTHLGNTLVNQGRYEESLEYLKASLDSLLAIHGTENSEVGIAMNSLANAYHYLGRYDEAGPLYEEALGIHRRVLGEKHPFVVTDLANLAYLARSKGDIQQAESRFREVIALQRQLHPKGDPSMMHSFSGLAQVLQWDGRYAEAESLREEGLELARRLFGDPSEAVARQLSGLGGFYDATGQLRKALESYESALRMVRETLGEQHPLYATTLNNAGLARSELGDAAGAIDAIERAVQLSREVYGPEGSDTLLAMNNLARTYRDARRYDDAERLFREVVEIRLRTVGESHFSTGTSMIGLARLLARTGGHEEAIRLAREGSGIFEAAMGPDHFQTLRTQMIIGDVLRQAGRFEESEALLRKIYDKERELSGAESSRALRAGAILASTLAELGRDEESETLYQAALTAPEGTFDDNELNGMRRSYGRALESLGRFEEARAVLEACHSTYETIAGPRSPNALSTAEALAELHDAWAERDPGGGHASRATAWRERSEPAL